MSGFWVTILVLMCAVSALLLLAGGRRSRPAMDRDTLNKAFYHQRLQELEEDEAQGVVAERPEMVRELQQTLLLDIPQEQAPTTQRVSRWVLLPGVLLIFVVSIGFYLKTGGLSQVMAWRQAQQAYPALKAQVMDPNAKPLSMAALSQLGLGLRTALQHEPDNVNDWLMLGRIGMVLNNAGTATQAFERALQRAPNDAEVKLSYADVLTRSQDPENVREAGVMLSSMLKQDGDNLRVLSLYAFNAFTQQHFAEAIESWQKMLQLLPADDKRAVMIQRSIAQAKVDGGQQGQRLPLTVTLSAGAEKMLPAGGVLYISVTDGESPVPVAVKRMPLSHFPLSLTLDDSNAMMPSRLLSAQHQIQVRARISRDGNANSQSGDWFGQTAVMPFEGTQPLTVDINQQQP